MEGANLLVLTRTQSTLNAAREEIFLVRKSNKQLVDAISVDLTVSEEVSGGNSLLYIRACRGLLNALTVMFLGESRLEEI